MCVRASFEPTAAKLSSRPDVPSAAVLAIAALPTVALADGDGAVTGAAGGAVAGAVVGGPVGAAVGGVAGGVIGGVAPGPGLVVVAPGPVHANDDHAGQQYGRQRYPADDGIKPFAG